MKIISCIEKLAKEKNMSAYALCKKSGISQSALSNIKRKGTDPTFMTLEKICKGLDIKMSDLILLAETDNEQDAKKIQDYLVYKELIDGYVKLSKEQQKCILNLIHVFISQDGDSQNP